MRQPSEPQLEALKQLFLCSHLPYTAIKKTIMWRSTVSAAVPFYAAFPIRFFVSSFMKENNDASNSPITVKTPPMMAHMDVANR